MHVIDTDIDDAIRFPLPWRASNSYKDVPIILKALIRKHEAALKEAIDSSPLELSGTVELSEETKEYVAPSVAKKRMLKAVNSP